MTVGMETYFSHREKMTRGSIYVEHIPMVLILMKPALLLALSDPSSRLIPEIRR